MKHHFLRTFLILLLVAVLGAVGVYAAARYGTQEDPLVAKSYLTDVLEKEITDYTDAQIRAAVSDAQGRVQAQIRAAAGQQPGGHAVALADQAHQQMLGAHKAVAQVARRGPGLFDGLLSPLGKLLIAFDGTSLLTVGSSWLRLSSGTAAERGETRRDGKSITKRFTKYMQNQRF